MIENETDQEATVDPATPNRFVVVLTGDVREPVEAFGPFESENEAVLEAAGIESGNADIVAHVVPLYDSEQ